MTGWTVGDLEPPLSGTALSGTVPVSLATATAVTIHVERADATTFTRAVVPATNQTTDPGKWSMVLVTGDLSVSGDYTAQIRVAWPGTRPQTFGSFTFPVARKIP